MHWEKAHGLNLNDPADANKDLNGDGYTDLEKYLNSLAGGYSMAAKYFMKTQRILAVVILLAGFCTNQSVFAREKWPVMPEAEKQQQEEWQQHEQAVLTSIQPALAEWAQKGKPFICLLYTSRCV